MIPFKQASAFEFGGKRFLRLHAKGNNDLTVSMDYMCVDDGMCYNGREKDTDRLVNPIDIKVVQLGESMINKQTFSSVPYGCFFSPTGGGVYYKCRGILEGMSIVPLTGVVHWFEDDDLVTILGLAYEQS